MYNNNKYFFVHENVFLFIQGMYNKNILLYKRMYNNKHFLIHENNFSLYKTMYNKMFVVIIHEDV